MSSSESLMQGLTKIVRCPICFVCVINFKSFDYFFSLGQHSFFLINEDLEKIRCEIYLAHIETVFIDNYKFNVLQIQFSDNRDNQVPAKMNMLCEDRPLLISHLSAAWKTDYMYRKGRIKNMPLYKADLTDQMKDVDFISKNLLPAFLTDSDLYRNIKKHELNGYFFFLNNALEQQKEVGVYKNPSNKCKIFLQISDPMPLEFIPLLRDKEDLKFYSQIFLDSIMGDRKDYWIMSSRVYHKRNNLTLDLAQWCGWETHIRSAKRDTLIIILRRKFIPPMLDVFQDIAIVMNGPDLKKKDQETSNEYITYLRDMADSLYSVNTLHITEGKSIYDNLIKEKANGLLLDDETYFFYQYNKEIKPKQITFGIKYLCCILDILSHASEDYAGLKKLLLNKYQNEIKEDSYSIINAKEADPTRLIDEFFNRSFHGSEFIKKKLWLYKLSRYLAYCVDGGLLNGQFSLSDILHHYHNFGTNSVNSGNLLKVINFLLHLTTEKKDEIDTEFFQVAEGTKLEVSNILNKMKKINSGNYIYNEKVMKTLIENDFFFNEFKRMSESTNDPPQLYADVLIQLLVNAKSSALKCSICRHLISFQADLKNKDKEGEDDYMKTVFKTLNKPLIEMYKSPNRTLATLAAVALLNICWNSKEIKFLIVFDGGGNVALHNLTSRDETLLRYSLQLVMSLCSIYQNIENFIKNGLIEKLLSILGGTKVPETSYSDKVISLVLQIIRIIIGQTDSKFQEIEKHLGNFLSILDNEYANCEDVEIEMIGLLKKMAMKNNSCKKAIGLHMIKSILEKMGKQQVSKPKKVIEAYLQLLCILVKDSEEIYLKEMLDNDARTVLKNYMTKTQSDPTIYQQVKFLNSLLNNKFQFN